jgi:hypothetical protein
MSLLDSIRKALSPTPELRKTYRIDGTDVYEIDYVRQSNGTFRLYCHRHPPIPAAYSKSVEKCHLYADGQICVSAGKSPTSLDQAQAIGMFFCRGFSQYVRRGVFPNGAAKIDV